MGSGASRRTCASAIPPRSACSSASASSAKASSGNICATATTVLTRQCSLSSRATREDAGRLSDVGPGNARARCRSGRGRRGRGRARLSVLRSARRRAGDPPRGGARARAGDADARVHRLPRAHTRARAGNTARADDLRGAPRGLRLGPLRTRRAVRRRDITDSRRPAGGCPARAPAHPARRPDIDRRADADRSRAHGRVAVPRHPHGNDGCARRRLPRPRRHRRRLAPRRGGRGRSGAIAALRPRTARRCRLGGGCLTWLVLFDVDGTLLLTHDEVYVEASRLALEAVYGIYAEGPDVPGDTAPAHIRRALRSVGVPEAEIDAGLPRWCETFSAHYVRLLAAADTSHWQVGPHAAEAAAAVEHRALLSGNPPAVAHARMERLGLAELFP